MGLVHFWVVIFEVAIRGFHLRLESRRDRVEELAHRCTLEVLGVFEKASVGIKDGRVGNRVGGICQSLYRPHEDGSNSLSIHIGDVIFIRYFVVGQVLQTLDLLLKFEFDHGCHRLVAVRDGMSGRCRRGKVRGKVNRTRNRAGARNGHVKRVFHVRLPNPTQIAVSRSSGTLVLTVTNKMVFSLSRPGYPLEC